MQTPCSESSDPDEPGKLTARTTEQGVLVLRRILALLNVRLRAHMGGELIPFAALLAQGSLIAAMALIVRTSLEPFGFSLFVLAVSAGLVALTLLGEFGSLLRSDPAAAWVESLPATAMERRLGHSLAMLVLLSLLSCSVLIPAALLGPESMSWGAKGLLLVAGLAQGVAIGSGLLLVQVVLGERVEGLLVLLQTVLVIGAVTGLLNAPGLAPQLAAIESGEAPWPELLNWLPSAWYATFAGAAPATAGLPPLWLLVLGTLGAILLLTVLPPAPHDRGGRGTSMLGHALRPFRMLATRHWLRRAERGTFDLVYDALPLERDFVLRTYPMVGIPLAFLVVGADGEGGEGMRDLLALLLFTPAIYLPVLLAHVPVTSSPGARWILETAPISPIDIQNGAIKALAIRFLLPLYSVLAGLALFFAGPMFALRMAVPGAILTLSSLRMLYPRCTLDLPLSAAASDVEVHHDWTGFLLTLAVGLTILAICVQRLVVGLPQSLALIAGLVVFDLVLARSAKGEPDSGVPPAAAE